MNWIQNEPLKKNQFMTIICNFLQENESEIIQE